MKNLESLNVDDVEEWKSFIPEGQRDGNARNFTFKINSLSIGDKTNIILPAPGVTAIVGGNNVGKSTLMRQVHQTANSRSLSNIANPQILREISSPWGGSTADMMAWLQENASLEESGGYGYFRRGQLREPINYLGSRRDELPTPEGYADFFITFSTAFDRLDITKHTQAPQELTDPATHPMHVFASDENVSDELVRAVREIFGVEMTIDTIVASQGFRIGSPGISAPPVDRGNPQYNQAVAKLPKLSDQGDGLRSAAGLLMPMIAQATPVILVDEPEAFLHPPQARTFGRIISRIATEKDIQLILATHDRNLLMGLLDHDSSDVTVLNLTRQENESFVQPLSNADIRMLLSNPVLRFGNAVDGLFSKAVILTESESDSTFYAAAVDAHQEEKEDGRSLDLHFVSVSGKHRMKKAASMLRSMGVEVRAIADLDILNDKKTLQELVSSLGGNWQSIESLYDQATKEFMYSNMAIELVDVKNDILEIINKSNETILTKSVAGEIRSKLKASNPWTKLKADGMGAFLANPDVAREMASYLDQSGLITVQVGELEGFFRKQDIPKGDRWVGVALEEGAHKSVDAQNLIQRLLKSLKLGA